MPLQLKTAALGGHNGGVLEDSHCQGALSTVTVSVRCPKDSPCVRALKSDDFGPQRILAMNILRAPP